MTGPTAARPGPGRLWALGLIILSPLCAESLSAYDHTTGDPVALLGGLLILGPLYGCPALLIRETARRFGLRWPGIVALCMAFGILQAGVIDQSMFSTSYRDIPSWDDMLLPTLIEPLGLSAYLATTFIVGHVVWSFGAPIALVESLAGSRARTPWLRWPGLLAAALLFAAAAALIHTDHLRNEEDHASAAQVGGALAVVAVLVGAALTLGRRRSAPAHRDISVPSPRILGLLSLTVALGFQFLPPNWPGFATAVALLTVSAGLLLHVSRSTRWDGRHVVAVAGGAVLALALVAFLTTPLGDVPTTRKYAHNIVVLLGSMALIAWAARRNRHRAAARPRQAAAGDGGSPRSGDHESHTA